jgi:dimethylglycine dehydrogenase
VFGKSIAMGYVRADLATPGTVVDVRMQGGLWPATIVPESPHDAANASLRCDG